MTVSVPQMGWRQDGIGRFARPVFAVAGTLATWILMLTGTALGAQWQDAPIWNDGKAEVSVYDATETKYGTPRQFTATFIVVAEDLRNDTLVKSDERKPPGGLTRVLKMNQVYQIPTGIYSYQQMASIFLRKRDLAPIKASVTSSEWCGNTFVLLESRGGKATVRGFSYFDGEAERTQTVDLTGAILYDALPLAVRAIPFGAGLERRIRIASQILGGRLPNVRVGDAMLAVQELGPVETGMGAIEGWRIEIKHAEGTDQLWIERAAPNRLLKWVQADGGTYALRGSKRLAYWTLTDPGDEKALSN